MIWCLPVSGLSQAKQARGGSRPLPLQSQITSPSENPGEIISILGLAALDPDGSYSNLQQTSRMAASDLSMPMVGARWKGEMSPLRPVTQT